MINMSIKYGSCPVTGFFKTSSFLVVCLCRTDGTVLIRALFCLSIYRVRGGRTTHIKGFLVGVQQETSEGFYKLMLQPGIPGGKVINLEQLQ